MARQARSIRRLEVEHVDADMQRDARRIAERAFARTREIGGEYYHGLDPRRRNERADAGLIQEDHTQIANLPSQARHHEFPEPEYYGNHYIADLKDI